MATSQAVGLQLLNTLSIIGILILVGAGLGIIFGLMNVLNLAHGEFVMLGAYSVVVANSLGLGFWAGLVLAVLVVGLIGYVIEVGLVSRLYLRPLDALLATWGVSLILQQVVRLVFGPEPKAVVTPIEGATSVFGLPYPTYKLVMLVLIALVAAATWALFRFPTFGLKTRAVLQDKEMAQSLGISASRVNSQAFAIGAGLSGLAGALIAPLITVNPFLGPTFLVRGFLTVIVGGIGSVVSTWGGAAVIGGTEGVVSYWGSSVFAQVIVLSVAIIFIRFRPQGLIPRK